MTTRELTTQEQENLIIFGVDAAKDILETLVVGDEVCIYSTHISNPPRHLEMYMQELREKGLDIGRGGAQYGFRMPVPAKTDKGRDLIIFRRN